MNRRSVFASVIGGFYPLSLAANIIRQAGNKALAWVAVKARGHTLRDISSLFDVREVDEGSIIFVNDELSGLSGYVKKGSDFERIFRAATYESLSSSDGANAIQYRPFGYLRGVGDKLDDNRTALDFISRQHHQSIRDGTSKWDASADINKGIRDIGGRPIDFSACSQVAIGMPIEPIRGTKLFSNCTFDNFGNGGTKIFLLNGANCPMLLSPKARAAADGIADLYSIDSEHNYLGLEGFVFDGNAKAQSQTNRLMKLGAVQWFGEYIGTEFRRNLVFNTRGCGLSFTGDVSIDNTWVLDCYFPVEDYGDPSSKAESYAVRFNPGLGGNEARGIFTIGSLFCERPTYALAIDVRKVPERRANAIHLNRVLSFAATRIHTEGAVHGVSLSSCRSVSIVEYSGAWMGGSAQNDGCGISICDDGTRRISLLGGMIFGGTLPSNYRGIAPVKKRAGVDCAWLPDVEPAPSDGIIGAYINGDPQCVSRNSISGNL